MLIANTFEKLVYQSSTQQGALRITVSIYEQTERTVSEGQSMIAEALGFGLVPAENLPKPEFCSGFVADVSGMPQPTLAAKADHERLDRIFGMPCE